MLTNRRTATVLDGIAIGEQIEELMGLVELEVEKEETVASPHLRSLHLLPTNSLIKAVLEGGWHGWIRRCRDLISRGTCTW